MSEIDLSRTDLDECFTPQHEGTEIHVREMLVLRRFLCHGEGFYHHTEYNYIHILLLSKISTLVSGL